MLKSRVGQRRREKIATLEAQSSGPALGAIGPTAFGGDPEEPTINSEDSNEDMDLADLGVELELPDMSTLTSPMGATSMFELAQEPFEMSMFQQYGKLSKLSFQHSPKLTVIQNLSIYRHRFLRYHRPQHLQSQPTAPSSPSRFSTFCELSRVSPPHSTSRHASGTRTTSTSYHLPSQAQQRPYHQTYILSPHNTTSHIIRS